VHFGRFHCFFLRFLFKGAGCLVLCSLICHSMQFLARSNICFASLQSLRVLLPKVTRLSSGRTSNRIHFLWCLLFPFLLCYLDIHLLSVLKHAFTSDKVSGQLPSAAMSRSCSRTHPSGLLRSVTMKGGKTLLVLTHETLTKKNRMLAVADHRTDTTKN
jgi:hypothetical protein